MATIENILGNTGREVFSVSASATVYAALEIMAEHNIGALPVVDDGHLHGIFSERDYARKIILKGKSSHDTPVSELMTADVFTITPDTDVEACMAMMTEHHIRHLPVLQGDQLIGLVSIGDVVKSVIAKQEDQIQELHDYVSGNTY